MRRLLPAALALALAGALPTAGSGATVKVQPAPTPAPYSGAYQPQGVDEIGLWREDDEQERALATSPLLIRDEALTNYVRGVLCKAVGADRCGSVRLYILRFPIFNASMSPNGSMRIFSGLLLRARSEAELASVLGHEFGHFEKRHSLAGFKRQRSVSDFMTWAAVLASMSAQSARDFSNLQVTVMGGFFRYKRDQEREADLLGLGYLNHSQLRASAASRVWRNLILEREASAGARGLRRPDFEHNAFFASHPVEGERADYLYALALPDDQSRGDGSDRYAAAMAPWLPLFLDDQIKLNDFGASDFIINRLAETGWTATLWRARGDLYRARGEQRDLMNAADFYAKAVALDPTMAEAQRGLGFACAKTGRIIEGRAALTRYLELRPAASDAEMIRLTLSALGGSK